MLYRHCFFSFAVQYTIGRVQVHQDELKLNGTHQLLVYADDVNILGRSTRFMPMMLIYWAEAHTLTKNAEALVVASETVLEINADNTKYMVISRDQNAGRIQSIKTDNSSFERVEEFRYLATTLPIQNSIQEDSKSRLKSGMLTIIRCRIFCL
jgi:hypothetical protein